MSTAELSLAEDGIDEEEEGQEDKEGVERDFLEVLEADLGGTPDLRREGRCGEDDEVEGSMRETFA